MTTNTDDATPVLECGGSTASADPSWGGDPETAEIARDAADVFDRYYDRPGVTRELSLGNLLLSASWQISALPTVACVASANGFDVQMLGRAVLDSGVVS